MQQRSEGNHALQEGVLAWYSLHQRGLPWRATQDPYAILVSEVMLQQTQVSRVIPKYDEFLGRFPDLSSLAAAPTGEVIRAWSPLGYNRRAVRLQGAARQVMAEHGGKLPRGVEALRRLRGVGPYTASAVACFAFGQQVAVVDTNVRRVLGRALLGETRPPPQQVDRLAAEALPLGRAADWNQALMDIGATVCAVRQPRCQQCPAQPSCRWAANGQSQAALVVDARALAERRAAYRTQPPFKGSSRYYRGRIVERLRRREGNGGVPLAELGTAIKEGFAPQDTPWLETLLQGLEQDGLVRREGERVRLP
ncbi:MAG: A/G-specific adenine glycosylase [Chloroflexi bacterium]|nr:A/G-specific adenine glycosylase [Chloroflexota bacterium]